MSRFPHDSALIAHRCWRFSTRTGLLTSCVQGTEWHPRERLTARCLRNACDRSPRVGCTCGIYAWSEPGDLRRLVRIEPHTFPVWGKCSLWGDVALHEKGVRAEHAYPYELFISAEHSDQAQRLRSTYLVDVVTV